MDSKHDEQQLDTAICEALGMEPGSESVGDAKSRRAMHETMARLAAASPHMKPSPDLRARILQATATHTYKIDDYRKAGGEDMRWYKWGFYAAAAFLMLGAWYNISVGTKLEATRKTLSKVVDEANTKLAASEQRVQARTAALEAVFTPHKQVVQLDPATKKPVWAGVVNDATNTAVVIAPQELFPPGFQGQLVLPTAEGKSHAYQTTFITAPGKDLGFDVPVNAPAIRDELAKKMMAPRQVTPGGPGEPLFASE